MKKVTIMLGFEIVILAALLFGGAGTVRWAAGWGFLALLFCTTMALTNALHHYDPELLAERLKPAWQPEQPLWDKIFFAVIGTIWCSWIVFMGMDAVRYRWSHLSTGWQWIGVAGFLLGNYIVHLTFQANTFAAPIIKIQRERGQHVIDTGPYAIVRHPMYAGAGIYMLSMPLMLGSAWGIVGCFAMLAAVSLRIGGEEHELEQHLDGYREYKLRVRYRLIPGLW